MPAKFGSLQFSEQIAFFRRKLNLPTQSWTDIWNEQHDHAFVVAGANSADLVADFREAVDKAIVNGTTLAEFRKDFDRIVAKHGWDYNGGRNWRSRVIYETNLRTSYAAGRYAQMQAIKHRRPFWQYEHSDYVEHPRPDHESWNGLILHADDPWWDTHFPPNGWGCQCSVRSLGKLDMERLGKDGPDQAPPDETVTTTVGERGPNPRVVETPRGVDPGFGYSPGKNAFERLAQMALQKAAKLPATPSAINAANALAQPRIQTGLAESFAQWVNELASTGLTKNVTANVGALKPDLIASLIARGIEPETAIIAARDKELWHTIRDSMRGVVTKVGGPKSLTPDELASLPALLANPQAVLLDEAAHTLLFVAPSTRREAAKLVVGINYQLKTTRGVERTNAFRTAHLIDYADVVKDVRAGKLVLLKGTL